MRKLPIDVSSFKVLRNRNYIYVDKTNYIYDLYNLTSGGRFYFLSRPRRFGKSLFISTLKEFFLGNKDIFDGLWIAQSDYEWESYPVIHLDFSKFPIHSGDALKISLNWVIETTARQYGLDVSDAPEPGLKLETLVRLLSVKNPVVILVDEYDFPLVNNIHQKEIAKEIHTVLRSFYSAMKGLDEYLHAIFVTGVSKFSKTSLFSGLNNLNDLSFDPRAATLLGYTNLEIERYFEEHLDNFAAQEIITKEKLLEKMKAWYDNYRFSEKEKTVYNPFSVLYCLQKNKFSNYWFETGTPRFLVELLKENPKGFREIEHVQMTSSALGPFDIGNMPLIPILYQTGYLTISNHEIIMENEKSVDLFTLMFPNLEVSESFKRYLLAAFVDISVSEADLAITRLLSALKRDDIDSFCETLQILLAHIPYQLHIPQERYYHSLFQLVTGLLSIISYSEIPTDKGRIDMIIVTRTHIYIFELKLDSTAEIALQQIEDRKYYERFLAQDKKIVLVGLSFDQKIGGLNLTYQYKKL